MEVMKKNGSGEPALFSQESLEIQNTNGSTFGNNYNEIMNDVNGYINDMRNCFKWKVNKRIKMTNSKECQN